MADLASVDEAGIFLTRHMDVKVQDYAIDDFQLQGLATTPDDRDGDGIEDDADKCPDEFGVPEEQGCPKKYTLIKVTKKKNSESQKVDGIVASIMAMGCYFNNAQEEEPLLEVLSL